MIQIVGFEYAIDQKIGSGAFGDIYHGTNIKTNEEVAIKLEPVRSKHPQLLYETKLYRILQGGVGIPNVHWYGVEGDYNVMVIDLLGPSLEDLFNYCKRKFSIKTVLMLADQMIQRIEYVHSKGYLHFDIDPRNILIGSKYNKSIAYLIDFGFARKFQISKDGNFSTCQKVRDYSKLSRFASINSLIKINKSRSDDYESLCLMLIYFMKGSLPWHNLKATSTQSKSEAIKNTKMSISIKSLCKGLYKEFADYLNYVRSLNKNDKPDTQYMRKIFKHLFYRLEFEYDKIFDWTKTKVYHSITAQSTSLDYDDNEEEKMI